MTGLLNVSQGLRTNELAASLSISGVVIELVGMVFRRRADEHLSQAIWWYNESLTRVGVR